ncbi:hypothetical protein M1D52_07320 [Olivibacter sp. SA151]|uniref:NACHT domain-containing protein n=1 Tax=Olivibacter jilunii TaxID=985016 RepID=UPI003F180F41
MHYDNLPWEMLNWEKFECLVVYLSQIIYDDPFFEKYLKGGCKQDGIDILSFDYRKGKQLCIQCKFLQRNKLNFDDIVKEFRKGKFLETSSHFTIATTVDLQNQGARNQIEKLKSQFRNEHNIDLYVWDVNYLNQELKKHYRLVLHYFGKRIADEYCFLPRPKKVCYQPIDNYIVRSLTNIKNNYGLSDFLLERQGIQGQVKTLTDKLVEWPLKAKKICLLADAYEGKSTLLNQTAFEITEKHSYLTPYILTLKSYNLAPINVLLDMAFQSWQSIPVNDLIVMIDGLDEVPEDKFLEAIKHIHAFTTEYQCVNLIFSCRTLFFYQGGIGEKLHDVEFYHLNELTSKQIDDYLKHNLFDTTSKFYNHIHEFDLNELISHPFYLTNLAKWFGMDQRKMPKSRLQIVERFLEDSLIISAQRELSKGLNIESVKVKYKKTVQKLALTFQIAGVNSCDNDFLQEIFDTEEIVLLKHNTFINFTSNKWTFSNALFQEQFAALALNDYDITQIESWFIVGKRIRKIRSKWIQTITSFLSLMEDTKDRDHLLHILEQDNVELLCYTDGESLQSEYKLKTVSKIIDNCIRRSSRLISIRENHLASFIGQKDDIKNYVIECLAKDIPDIVKIVCCRVILNLCLKQILKSKLIEITVSQLKKIQSPVYGKLLLDILISVQYKDKALINNLMDSTYNADRELRDGIYQYLVTNDWVDEFYDFGLRGFSLLYEANKKISIFGSESTLLEFCSSTKSSSNFRKFICILSSQEWKNFYKHKSSSVNEFAELFVKLISRIYETDISIIFPVVNLLLNTDNEYFTQQIVEKFIDKYNLRSLSLQICFLNDNYKYSPFLGQLISGKQLDLILRLYEDDILTRKDLTATAVSLYKTSNSGFVDQLQSELYKVFGKRPKTKEQIEHEVYLVQEETLKKNDVLFIQSKETFAEALKQFFLAHGKEEVNIDELYDIKYQKKLVPYSSNFLTALIRKAMGDYSIISHNACLDLINSRGFFKQWRVKKILNCHLSSMPQQEVLIGIVRDFFYENIKSASFENTYYRENGQLFYRKKEVLLGEIWKQFKFEIDNSQMLNFLWLDTSGIKGIQTGKINKKETISSILLEKLADQTQLIKNKVKSNIEIGIQDQRVKATHIDLCRHLQLYETCDTIIEMIVNNCLSDDNTYWVLEVLNELETDFLLLESYFKEIEDYTTISYFQFVKYLTDICPRTVRTSLLKCMESKHLSSNLRIEAARNLAHLGEKQGFLFIMNYIASTKASPFEIQGKLNIWNVETSFGLMELEKVMFLFHDKKYHADFFAESIDRILIEILYGFASKSENDLCLVQDFMLDQANLYEKNNIGKTSDLKWYADLVTERFRDIDMAESNPKKIKKMLEQRSHY